MHAGILTAGKRRSFHMFPSFTSLASVEVVPSDVDVIE